VAGSCLATNLTVLFRVLWTKYKRQKENAKYDGILQRRDTSESIARPLHSHLLNSDKVIYVADGTLPVYFLLTYILYETVKTINQCCSE
jgi:hypothetical protein